MKNQNYSNHSILISNMARMATIFILFSNFPKHKSDGTETCWMAAGQHWDIKNYQGSISCTLSTQYAPIIIQPNVAYCVPIITCREHNVWAGRV